jgi:hypothetical protein
MHVTVQGVCEVRAFTLSTTFTQTVVLLTYIQEVSCSNVGRDTH